MIRMTLALFVLALALCAWIVFGKDGTGASLAGAAPGPSDMPEVTRAATAPAYFTDLVPEPLAPPAVRVATEEVDLALTTAHVLEALGVAVEPPGGEDALRDMSVAALAGLAAATGEPARAGASGPAALDPLVAQALREGRSDAYIDALVNEAARAGTVSVPRLLVTEDGRVDTAVLLASILAEAERMTTGQTPPVPEIAPDMPGVEVRVVQRADESQQYRFYTVQAGDSLGGIAQRFYGSAARFETIFDANRQLLSSPDRIRVGQRLVIPET